MTERQIIETLAKTLTDRIVNRVIRILQARKDALASGDDSGLCNTWDEICVQVQGEESILWNVFQADMELLIHYEVAKLAAWECAAIWVASEEGADWACEREPPYDELPWMLNEVEQQIKSDLLNRAADYRNKRIAKYMDPACDDD